MAEWNSQLHVLDSSTTETTVNLARGQSAAVAIFTQSTWGADPGPSAAAAVGLAQSANVSSQRQVAEVFEIGSLRKYLIPGIVMCRAQLAGVVFSLSTGSAVTLTGKVVGTSGSFDLTDQSAAVGIGIVFFNIAGTAAIGGVFLERCFAEASGIQVTATGDTVVESLSIKCDRVKTLTASQAAGLITDRT